MKLQEPVENQSPRIMVAEDPMGDPGIDEEFSTPVFGDG